MEINPAIVISAYNRPYALQRLLNSIAGAVYETPGITLIISIDKSPDKEVAAIAENFNWGYGTKKIIYHKEHLGLKQHILSCGALTKNYEAVIVLEDDLMVSPYFYEYAKQAYHYYKEDPSVAGISLYNYEVAESCFHPFKAIDDGSDVYFMQVASSWGQLWTKQHWIDFETWFAKHPKSEEDPAVPVYLKQWGPHSWKKHFIHYLISGSKYFVFPRLSLSTNFEEQGTNSSTINVFGVPLQTTKRTYRFREFKHSPSVYDASFELLPASLNQWNPALASFKYEVDLYGTKQIIYNNCDYILSSKQADNAELLFSADLFPLESNIILNVAGNDIGLYKKPGNRFFPKTIKLHNYLDGTNNEKEYGISVIIPVDDVNITDLKETINSIIDQKMKPLECLLVCQSKNYEALINFASGYQQKIRIVICDRGYTSAMLLACGFARASNGIVTWLMPGNSYSENAFSNAYVIFKSHPLLAWIKGTDHIPSTTVDLNNTELSTYRMDQNDVYEKLCARSLNTDTQLQFFRRHCIKELNEELSSLHELFFYLTDRYLNYVVVSKLGTRSKQVSLSIPEAETERLLNTYGHFRSERKSLKLNLIYFSLKLPLFSKNSKYLLSIHLKNLPDVLRYDEKHDTFYFSKF